MSKFVAAISLAVLSFIVSIWIMMTGWGLEAESWGVIIGGHVINVVILSFMQACLKE